MMRLIPLIYAAAVNLGTCVLDAQTPMAERVYSISGVITDASDSPLPGVEVMIVRDSASAIAKSLTRSANDGTFSFTGIPGGRLYLRVRRLGYRLSVIQIRPDTLSSQKPLRVALQATPVELAAVEVEAGPTQATKDFDERRPETRDGTLHRPHDDREAETRVHK